MVDQLNTLLADRSYWSPTAREQAVRDVGEKVAAFFYDGIKVQPPDPWADREAVIPLPMKEDGYSCGLLVGPTRAGKTTLLRQLIGSDPERDRFPSTSTAKTTIYDIEVILAATGSFRAVVSFLGVNEVRSYIEECVVAAMSAAMQGKAEDEILGRLLEHSEQRFRLSYLLGALPRRAGADEELEDDCDGGNEGDEGVEGITADEKEQQEEALRGFLERIQEIAADLLAHAADGLEVEPSSLDPEDYDAFVDIAEREILGSPRARQLVDDILDEVESKFEVLREGEFSYDVAEWPARWTYETSDRGEFLRTVNRLSSNYAREFGRLLAPLVRGMRVQGPFKPAWLEDGAGAPKIILVDGEGLGHTPASASALPTSVTRRYGAVDVILLVDDATQPMQAASQEVLRSVVASGHDAKLAIAFTHFDQVQGPNMPSPHARRQHVLASLEGVINHVDSAIGADAGRRLRRRLEERTFFFSGIQKPLSTRNRLTQTSFRNLLSVFEEAMLPPRPTEDVPVYDLANLVLSVQKAAQQFQEHWNARLGLTYKPGVTGEHWARIKALSRRYANQWSDQYDTLRPVADLIKFLSERLAYFLASPRAWEPADAPGDMQEAALDAVAQAVYARLHDLATKRLFQDYLNDWITAYAHRGTGSTRVRAREIRTIYETAAPVPEETPAEESVEFLDAVRDLFREAAEAAGAKVVS